MRHTDSFGDYRSAQVSRKFETHLVYQDYAGIVKARRKDQSKDQTMHQEKARREV